MKSSIEMAGDGGRKSGSALILVLWVIGMLSMIAVSFAFDAHLEGKIVSYSRKKLKAEQFALSGFELAKSYLHHADEIDLNAEDSDREEDPQYELSRDLRNGKPAHIEYIFKERDGEEEEGRVSVDIEPEDSLRNVNKLTEDDWERILELVGVPETDWPDIIDSFYDWIDEDDSRRFNGAENEYYEELEKPYTAANSPLESVRELLLIRGFNEAILSGGQYDPDERGDSRIVISNGIERLLSVYGEGKVNINAIPASEQGCALLMTLPGVDDELTASAILEEREEGSNLNASDENDRAFSSEEDARSRLANIVDGNEFFNSISTKSEIFRITSIGAVGRVSKRISALIYAGGGNWRILRWEEESR